MQPVRARSQMPILVLVLLLPLGCMNQTKKGQTEGVGGDIAGPEVATGQHGMVASDAPLATAVGVRVLQDGGNAIDAAVATAFALAVVYPEAGNIGGGGFLLARLRDGNKVALDFREVAPGNATRDMYLDADSNVTSKSLVGHLASGVPGSVAGLWEAHQQYGSKPWRELLQPAIGFAQNGFIVDDRLSRAIAADERLRTFPASAKLLLRDGSAPMPGTRLDNPDLAATLRRIAEQGRDGFYKGETADLIVAEMQRGGGLITHEDLAKYQPRWRRPVTFLYRGHQVISMAPASSGGITLAIMANILDGYNLRALGPSSAQRYHLIAEASRRAFADRNHFLGDPDFVKIPVEKLISPQYAEEWRATISRDRATPSLSLKAGIPKGEPAQTTHFSIVDARGNAVGLTTTINELHGSAITVTGAGFLLNDEMDDFTSKVGAANMFGLVQGEANAIAPGKRMLSAMTPTIVVDRAGKTLLVTGARGGPRIISAVFQIVSNVLDHEMTLPHAVSAPRIHHQHLPDTLFYESGVDETALAALRQAGHITLRRGSIGSAPTILRVGDQWTGMADTRSGGAARGY